MFKNLYGDGRDNFDFEKRGRADLMGSMFGDMVVGEDDSWWFSFYQTTIKILTTSRFQKKQGIDLKHLKFQFRQRFMVHAFSTSWKFTFNWANIKIINALKTDFVKILSDLRKV